MKLGHLFEGSTGYKISNSSLIMIPLSLKPGYNRCWRKIIVIFSSRRICVINAHQGIMGYCNADEIFALVLGMSPLFVIVFFVLVFVNFDVIFFYDQCS
jgi:hypothetical protein